MPDNNDTPMKFYVSLAGNGTPQDYIELAEHIEDLGFDRICIYDDLMYYSSSQILAVMALHTEKIELGPCLVNGFYRHPAVIAKEAAFLEALAPGRSFLGIGRGAFYDYYEMQHDEAYTRTCLVESIQQIKRLWAGDKTPLNGEFFRATSKAFLRVPLPEREIPIIVGAWSPRLAWIAGEQASALQTGEIWNAEYLIELRDNLLGGAEEARTEVEFSPGGLSCVVEKEDELGTALAFSKVGCAVYLPYLQTFIRRCGFDPTSEEFQEMFRLSGEGEYVECSKLIPTKLTKRMAMLGTCDQVVDRIEELRDKVGIDGIMFGPPYGVSGDIKTDLKLIMEKVVEKLKP